MKNKILFIALILLAVFFSMLTGCTEEETMSINDRIREFVTDLNKLNRDSVFKDHFHPDASSYDGDDAVADDNFPNDGGEIYAVISITETSTTTRAVVITDGSGTNACVFTMKEDGEDDWYIWSITGTGVSL